MTDTDSHSDSDFETDLRRRLGELAATAPERPSPGRGVEASPSGAVGDRDGRSLSHPISRGSTTKRPRVLALAAAALLAVVGLGSVLLWAGSSGGGDRDPDGDAVLTSSPAQTSSSAQSAPDPTGEVGETPSTAVPPPSQASTLEPGSSPPGRQPVEVITIEPAGPYEDGQRVVLTFSSELGIDIRNWSAAICGRALGAEVETCDRTSSRPEVISDGAPADGLHRLAFKLERTHLGPEGPNDCGDPNFRCRVVQRDDRGGFIASADLEFRGDRVEPAVTLEVRPGDRPGEFIVDPDGIDADADALDLLTPAQAELAGRISDQADAAPLVSWALSTPCAYADGLEPVGSAELAEVPGWWARHWRGGDSWNRAEDPATGRTVWLGDDCDLDAATGLAADDPNAPVTYAADRGIDGYSGYLDCVDTQCFVAVSVRILVTRIDGSTLSFSRRMAVAPLPFDEDSPIRPRPSLAIVEPGPYRPGQTVTAEVRDLGPDHSSDVAWCDPDRASGCGHRGTRLDDDGVRRIEWKLPNSSDCGPNRCYFAIPSGTEGVAPPAVLVVPITE